MIKRRKAQLSTDNNKKAKTLYSTFNIDDIDEPIWKEINFTVSSIIKIICMHYGNIEYVPLNIIIRYIYNNFFHNEDKPTKEDFKSLFIELSKQQNAVI